MDLEKLKSRLEMMTAKFNREVLKTQALLKAEEEREARISALEAKIKSYKGHP